LKAVSINWNHSGSRLGGIRKSIGMVVRLAEELVVVAAELAAAVMAAKVVGQQVEARTAKESK
jgi:hypothetical protein